MTKIPSSTKAPTKTTHTMSEKRNKTPAVSFRVKADLAKTAPATKVKPSSATPQTTGGGLKKRTKVTPLGSRPQDLETKGAKKSSRLITIAVGDCTATKTADVSTGTDADKDGTPIEVIDVGTTTEAFEKGATGKVDAGTATDTNTVDIAVGAVNLGTATKTVDADSATATFDVDTATATVEADSLTETVDVGTPNQAQPNADSAKASGMGDVAEVENFAVAGENNSVTTDTQDLANEYGLLVCKESACHIFHNKDMAALHMRYDHQKIWICAVCLGGRGHEYTTRQALCKHFAKIHPKCWEIMEFLAKESKYDRFVFSLIALETSWVDQDPETLVSKATTRTTKRKPQCTSKLAQTEDVAEERKDEADKAQDGAQMAQDDAQMAQDDAQMAQDDAQMAQDDAQMAQDDAQMAQDEAEMAQDEAEMAQDEAEMAQGEAVKPKEEAEKPEDEAEKPKEEAEKVKSEAEKEKDEAQIEKNEAEGKSNDDKKVLRAVEFTGAPAKLSVEPIVFSILMALIMLAFIIMY